MQNTTRAFPLRSALSLLLALALLCALLPLPSAAETETPRTADIVFGNTLAAGEYGVKVIRSDGTLWTWGDTRWDEESGSFLPVTQPEQVPGISNVASVEMSNSLFSDKLTLAVTADGALWNWGDDFLGRLGRESSGDKQTPGKVMDRVRSVSAGFFHTAAVTEDGTLWTWGENGCGQLGNGGTGTIFECWDGYSLYYETLPVKVMTDVVSVAAGDEYTAAIRSDGSLWTWGINDRGQLGNGGVGNAEGRPDYNDERPLLQTVPVKVMEDVAMVCPTLFRTYAIKTDGSLWSWGGTRLTPDSSQIVWDAERGAYLWDESTVRREIVLEPEKLMDDVVYVSSNNLSTAAIKSDGSLWTWGANTFGILGRGTDEENLQGRSIPQKLMDGVATVAVGGNFMVAVTYDGGVWTWGWNDSGSLGNGTTEDSYVPIRVMEGAAIPASVRIPENSAALDTQALPMDAVLTADVDGSAKGTTSASQKAAASVSIPESASYFNGHAYQAYTGSGTWEQAEEYCESLGGHLAVITSEQEQSFLSGINMAMWIGGRRNSSGSWYWVNGERWSYTNWNEGEPNNSGGREDCIVLWPEKWNDLASDSVGSVSGMICEWDSVPGQARSVAAPEPLPNKAPADSASFCFDANGGSVSTKSISLTTGALIGTMPTPTREGYTFEGWYTEPEGGNPLTEFIRVTHTGDQTVYAHWVKNRAQPGVSDLSLSFGNSPKSFGYQDGFRYPLEAFEYFFGKTDYARACYEDYAVWSGSCYGMSTAASIIYSQNDIALSSFRSDAKTPADLSLNDWSDSAYTNLGGMIELMQISQYNAPHNKIASRNMNQYSSMAGAVWDFMSTGNHPVIVSIKGPRRADGSRPGHAMVAYGIYRDPETQNHLLLVYDPNFPGDGYRRLDLYRNSNGDYTGWYYRVNDEEDWGSAYDDGAIRFYTYDEYYPTWYYRGWAEYQSGMVSVNSDNASICDYAGNTVAEIRNGELISDRPDVYPLEWDDGGSGGIDGKGLTLFLPRGYYQIVNEDEAVEEFKLQMANGARSASVTTDADKVLCYVDEETDTDAVLVDGYGASYEIVFSGGENTEEVRLSGTNSGREPGFLARQNGTLYAMGVDARSSELTLNGRSAGPETLQSGSILSVVTAAQPEVVSAAFTDVSGDSDCAAAVLWALNRGVTAGTAPGRFSPEDDCTRAQTLTLIWRALGRPESEARTNPFVDVKESDYYYQAVLWAVGAGVTAGTDETHFSPAAACTRAETLRFLWRALGEPLGSGEGDADALRWAAETGTAPGARGGEICPRGDTVEYLYRALG